MSRRQLNLPPSTAKNALIRHKSFWSDHTFQPGAGASKEYWTLPFTKDKGASESYIHVHGIMCGEGASSYPYIGMYVTIDQHGRTDNEHDSASGIYYCGPDGNQDREGNLCIINKIFKCSHGGTDPNSNMDDTFTSSGFLSAGSHNINIGHSTRDGNNAKWCQYLNPNSGRQGRHQNSHACTVTIMEFAY